MRNVVCLSLSVIAFLAVGVARAQQGDASMRGRVVDEQGGALPGVVVVITHQESGVFRQVASNADGSYFVTGIIPGTYAVTAELSGFKKYERRGMLLELGKTMSLDITSTARVATCSSPTT